MPGWRDRTPYNRGQILYRMAEMLEGRRAEFATAIATTDTKTKREIKQEVDASIERLVSFAGWCDKFQHVLGCQNPVAGPYYNFTVPEPTGIVAAIAPAEPGLLGFITLLAPVICAGNTCVLLAGEAHPIPATIFAEVCATSDLPAGVVNILTGSRRELLEHIAQHREINAVFAANTTRKDSVALREGTAENLKRVRLMSFDRDDWFDDSRCHAPSMIEPFVEMKTIWHPSAM